MLKATKKGEYARTPGIKAILYRLMRGIQPSGLEQYELRQCFGEDWKNVIGYKGKV